MKKIFTIILTCGALWLCIYCLNYILRPTDTDGAYSQIESFHSLPSDSIEVIIYGSSHAFRGINPIKMYYEQGIGAYNYAWHWQAYNVNNVLHDTDMNAEIYYSRYIKDEKSKADYIKQCFGEEDKERYLAYYVPICVFHDNWNSLTQASFSPLEGKNWLINTMGFAGSEEIIQIGIPDYYTYEQKKLSEEAIKELDKIVKLCKQQNAEIVFYTVPWYEPFNYGEAMKKYAEENNCAYVDLCEKVNEVGIDGTTDFSDPWHLNTSGSNKVATYMAKYLVDNYNLTDFRNIENNLWEGK